MASPKTIESTVAFTDPQNNVVANGLLVLDLSQAAEITSGGGQVAPKRVAITLTATGVIPNSTTIWANDQLTPSGTTYHSRLFDASGNQLADFGLWNIAGASPIDLSQMTPTATGASYPAPVLLSPAGDQEITAGNLIVDNEYKFKNGTAFAVTLSGTPTANRTATFPDNTGTIAELNLAQNFTALQEFSAGISPDGTHTATLPANTGTIAELNLAQTWSALQTFNSADLSCTSPVINGTPTGTGIPTVTLKQGTGNNTNYTTSSTSFVQVDATNLLYAVTVPTGWKLMIWAAGSCAISTASANIGVAITDSGTVLNQIAVTPAVVGVAFAETFAINWVLNGDGNSHSIDLRFKTTNASDAAAILNNTLYVATMTFLLTPSN